MLDKMKKNDQLIGDILSTFEETIGMKFSKFKTPEDPKYVAPKKKNLHLKLKIAERKQAQREKDPEKRWQRVMDLAQGVKLKDDPKMIKKTIKKKEQKKKQSRAKFEARPKPVPKKDRPRKPKDRSESKKNKNTAKGKKKPDNKKKVQKNKSKA